MTRPSSTRPRMPWTDEHRPINRLSHERRYALLRLWESIPRPSDLRDPTGYLEAMRLHRRLRDEYTVLFPLRARSLFRLARRVEREGIPGALVDCGTWNGGSTALMSAGAPTREVWAFDSFEGLPTPDERDLGRAPTEADVEAYTGHFAGSEEKLREAVALAGGSERLHVRKGWFADTLRPAVDEVGPIAVLHCDGDWYDSVTDVLESFYPSVADGGYVVVDDYQMLPGAFDATNDYRARVGDTGEIVRVDHYTGAFWRKASPIADRPHTPQRS